MPTPTYTPLANLTLSSAAASVTFSSISQAYRDLVLVVQPLGTSASAIMQILINSDTGTNYNWVLMHGDGSTTASSASSGITILNPRYSERVTSTVGYQAIINLLDYSATDKHKSMLMRLDNAALGTDTVAARWASTSAISSINFTLNSGSYASGSSFALYGIAS